MYIFITSLFVQNAHTSAAPREAPLRSTEGHLVNLLHVQVINLCVHVSIFFLRAFATTCLLLQLISLGSPAIHRS